MKRSFTSMRKLWAILFAAVFAIPFSSYSQTCTFPNQTVTAANTILNTYYPGTANVAAAATSITLGTSVGSTTPIAAGDLVMIMQMQGATQDATNTNNYGDGVAAAPASGYLVATAGTYEYGIAINAVPLAGGTLNLLTGTTNAYTNAAATGTQGQIRFQVIRVPRFNNLTINAAQSITCTPWNGTAGGVVAIDVSGTLNMNTTGTINVNGRGFRGGGGRQLGGGGGANTDIRTLATVNTNGAKGEGICGTPRYVYDGTALVNTAVEGYPNGSNGNGAPGNAGGGGTDADPANNDENTGGGGGGNAGAGGRGGRSWNSNLNIGGYGGVAPTFLATTRLIMGGGGGSGTTNDGTGTPGAGLASSGGIGGGIVVLNVNTITNAGTITANGANGIGVDNDGGGGGGAGGTVYVSATVTASLATLTVNARGGNGANAWPTVADAGAANDGNPEHGPGGGGGGGAIYSNAALVAGSSVAGGTNGITTTSNLAFGATAGAIGVKNQAATAITFPALTAPTATSNSPICAGSTLNLTSTPTIATATYSWTGPNSFTSTLQNPSIAAATAAATGTYSVSYTLGLCTAGPATTAVVVNAAPTTAAAGPDQTICTTTGTATMAGNVPAVGTGTWTFVSGPSTPTITTPGSATTGITGLTSAGTYIFQWTITNAPCAASSDQISVIVNAPPTTANAGPDQTICTTGGSATMAGNVPAVGTGTWTQVSGPVTATITTPGSATTTITAMTTAGTYVFQWTITNAPCTASSDQISVIVNAPPTASNAGPDASVCGLTATLAGNVPATGIGTWTLVAGPGTATFVNANLATTNVTVSVVGAYTFRWTIANAPCTASQDNVIITFVASPTTANAGPDQTICTTGGSATMAGNVPAVGTGTWTQVSGPVTATITTPGSATTTITGMTTAGTYVFQWSIANAPCAASTDQISVIVNAPPTASNAGPDQTICANSVTMAGNTPTTGTGTWTQVSGPNTATITTPGSASSTMTGLIAGTYVFQWTITNAPCTASSDQISVIVNAAPTTANAGPDQTICTTGGSATMAGNVPAVGTGTWTFVSGPSTPTITTPGSATTTITGMTTAGTYVFQWSIANAPCTPSTDQISVIVNAPPTVSNAGPDASVCGLTATLAGNVPATGTGTWTLVAGPGTATFVNANLATTNVTVSVVGAYTFRWTIANAPCTASQDNVIITFVASPTTANAGPDQTICTTGGSATMAGNVPAVGTGTWTQVSGPVTATITTPGSATTTITGMTTAGTYVFQWSIANAPCTPSTDQISVIVNAPPTASNAGPDASVCGLTATLAGNVPATGTGTWTLVAGPGTATFVNANLATTNVTVSVVGAYTFRWTIANAPCTASQDNVIITFVASPTVSNAGPDQTICTTGGSATMAGNVPTTGTGTWTQVSGPVTATINTPGSATTTITGMTTAGTYVFQWSIANAPCTPSTDQISVIVNAPPTTANAGPDQTICAVSATMAGNVPTTGTGTWTQVSGPNSATITTPGSATSTMTGLIAGTYVFQWTITNAPCTASSDQVSIVVSNPPTTSNAGPDQTICTTTGTATLAGNTPSNGTPVWTFVSGPSTPTITTPASPTSGVTGLTSAGTYIFQWTITTACGSSSDQISIIVNAPPTTSNAGPDQTICATTGTATMAGNVPTTGTGTWTFVSGPSTPTITTASSATTGITGLTSAGTYIFQWTITNAPCTASSDQISVIVNAAPTTANAGPDQTICTTTGTATMAGNVPTVGTGTWTFVSGPSTPTITTASSATTGITGLTSAGTYIFQWTITNAPCAASSDQISVIVNAPPTVSNAGPDASVCGLTATLAGNVPATGTGTWTLVAGPGTATFVNANLATTNVTVSVVGAYTFRWTIANAPCTASQDNVIITFVASPTVSNAGPDQTICTTGGSATMAGNVPAVGTGTWTFVSGPSTPTITTPGSATTTITGMTTAGTYVFQWSIANAPCSPSTDQISVIVNAPPTTANAGPDQTICAVSATMAGNVPTTGTGTWTQVSGPNSATITTPGSATSTMTGLIAGTYVFQWTITNAPCTASSDQIIVTVSNPPTTSNAGPDQTICTTTGTATLAGNTPSSGTPVWTFVSGPSTPTITTPASPTSGVTGLTSAGTYIFQWTITTACGSSSDQISIIVNAPPTVSNAGPDASVCGLTATLAGNVPATGTGTWTLVAGPGTATFVNANLATTNVTVSVVGVYTFRWTIANAPCTASQDNVIITFVASPTVANAGPDQTICTTGGSATMAGNVPTTGTGTWTQVSGPLTATITTPGSATTTITGMTTAGTYVFQWSIANAPCTPSTDQIVVTVNAPPTASNAGPDQTICGATVTMAGNTPVTGSGTWTQVSGPNTATITTPGSASSTMTGLITGTYVFQWTITNAPCTASSDQISVIVNAAPTTSNAGVDQTICSTGGSATMAGNVPTVGTGTWTQVSGPVTATITTPGSATTTITGMTTAGTYVFQWSIANAPCSPSTDQVQITVNAPPTVAAAGPDASVCGLTATFAGNVPTTGTGTWTLVSGPGTASFSNANSATSNVTVSVAGVYTFAWTIANAPCTSSADNVVITFVASPTVSNAGTAQTVCGMVATLAGNTPTTGTGLWTLVSGPGTITFSNASSAISTATASVSGTYTLQWTISNSPCPASSSTVQITFTNVPSVAAAGVDSTNCGLLITLYANTPAFGTGTWTVVSGPGTITFANANAANTTATASVAGVYVLQWTIANAPCAPSSDQVTINFQFCDHDGDGILDNVDPDDDNDGILDVVEGGGDTDGDGIPNYYDLDSDNDGITDVIEAGGSDPDGDGIIGNGPFVDTDGDGLGDLVDVDNGGTPLPNPDSDGDGIVDAHDLDSDNDGIGDVIEAGGSDPDGDGIIGTGPIVDTDGDGWSNITDPSNGGTPLPNTDTDGDGQPDATDLDSDNDGISDVSESGNGALDANNDGIVDGTDTDGDGIINVGPIDTNNTFGGSDVNNTPDTDGDGQPDAYDLDSDNDGISDVNESGNGALDANNDGIVDGTDTDGDGIINNSTLDNNSTFGGTNVGSNPDSDGDGQPDSQDLDSDNDGISDVNESGNGALDANNDGIVDGTDTDGDGIINNSTLDNNSTFGGTNVNTNPDSDGDGQPDSQDLDSDNDGISDVVESGNGALDANNDGVVDGTDTDGDGIINVAALDNNSSFGGTNVNNNPDTDGDGQPDSQDLDADNDGISDVVENGNGALDANNDGIIDGTDTDNDGVINVATVDNNSSFGGNNLNGVDFDGDGNINSLDLDSDNDGIVDVIESGNGALDANHDGMIDGTDTDGDGVINVGPIDTNNTFGGTFTVPTNTDSNGGPDYLDIDADNDGIVDNIEGQPSATYVAPTGNDSDNDGIDDAYDTINGFGGAGVTPTNTDGASDGADYVDLDADNDTFPDAIEGWDTNNDGTADTTPSGNDTDNDGLDDSYDNNDVAVNPTNGQVPTSFPNLDNTSTPELDWRESDDHDGDGIVDVLDPDDDNDGILDVLEGNGDTDGDGIPDFFDLDSDNDGIPDVVESGGSDPDGDGIIGTGPITDTDGDGLSDIVDPDNGGTPLVLIDSDGDGIPNIHDLDSDNDGITDVTEAGGTDANGDGVIDGYVDVDGDGFADSVDSTTGGTTLPTPDSDGDGHSDYVDLDSDNDGITDVTEAGGNDANGDGIIDGFVDNDNDGLADSVDPTVGGTPLPIPDTDGDGQPNYIDLDSDNDGITDVTEAGGTDANGDGYIDGYTDTDNDGLADSVDTNNGGTMLPVPDTDGDGHPNYLDLDSDNDGITDVTEAGGPDTNGDGIIDLFADADGDGLADSVDPSTGGTPLIIIDTDGDGLENYIDLDSDNDGIPDVVEAGGTDANGDGLIDGYVDSDNDGLADSVDPTVGGTPLLIPDTDGDGHANYIDVDSDNDGITDLAEAGGTDADGDGHVDGFNDGDGDGFADAMDTDNGGTSLPIPDTDGDGHVNYLDLDSDNDGITDVMENGGVDADGDGHIDNFTDSDNDGLADSGDPSTGGTPFLEADQDADGIPNYLDLDSDNDGIVDLIETGGADTDNNGIVDNYTDSDNDGLADSVDPSVGGTPNSTTGTDGNNDGRPDSYPNDNADNNGRPNFLDIDADDDGIVDNVEGQSTTGYVAPSGNDTDGDGIDDAYDTFNGFGGAGVTPVNTDGADTPDYIDLDTDNDGMSDLIEGNDFNNNNQPDVLPSGNDADGDGLDDSYDNVGTIGNGNAANNDGPPTATTFPDVDVIGGELDWRDPLDTDGDGISNGDDIDDDNDGILDVVEQATASNNGDTDGDGTPDSLDLDSDNDGIPDIIEANGSDPDNDGMVGTGPITDANGDGLDDSLAPNGLPFVDTDGDGHPDFQDLDSDNDGITDLMESGSNLTDANGDGIVDGTDSDFDGLLDQVDADNGGVLTGNPVDTDGDGIDDYRDLDSDNDGIADVLEGGGTDTNGDGHVDNYVDANNDGYDDNTQASSGNGGPAVPDSDGDGHPDYLDLDSDNDGIADVMEGGSPDANGDGLVDNFTDANGDGWDDNVENGSGIGGPAVPDSDGDGHPDYLDLDSDNDGIADVIEGGSPDANGDGHLDNFTDADNDGWDDNLEASNGNAGPPVPDSDGDGHPDYLDLDSDNDGIADVIEGGAPDVNGDGTVDNFTDLDGDGWDDNVENGNGNAGPPVPDTDGDGHPDYLDLDSDNDGIPDVTEGGGQDANGDGIIDNFTDADGDGWDDNTENGTGNGGPDVPDSDGDGHPDYLDLDSDNDGIPDVTEGGGQDANGDGTVDNWTDADGDGWDDNTENGTGNAGPDVPDTDGDGIPDYLDLDSDNDGIDDVIEGGGQDANGDGIIDNFTDLDGDGWDDNTENGTGNEGPAVPDTDGDGTPDYLDLDSDGDGIPDNQGDETLAEDCDGDGISNYLDPDPCVLVIPVGFSPNGDGINDIFEIVGINAYPDNKVTIFNRWGNIVYEATGYNNTTVRWDGTNTGTLSAGNGPVPEGTYFYVIDLGDGSPILSGYIYLNRQ